MAENARLPGERLEKVLSNLQIRVSRTQERGFIASTEQEPLFCFFRQTETEIAAVVAETLKSYIETFYNVSDVKVTVEKEVAESLPRPEVLTPVSRLIPSVSDGFNFRGREHACAY